MSELPVDTGGERNVSVGQQSGCCVVQAVCGDTADGGGKSTVGGLHGAGGRQYVDGRWAELPNGILFCSDGCEF